ncbi:unnamed protein product [marine sediment metagenome]|uniref:Uncharacterized protein n=1 Tax=marine sediment metagenome TaxID=412755 RepID=X0RJZ2_9ZZZZ
MYTVTINRAVGDIKEDDLHKWHIQDIMQRAEFEVQGYNGLVVMFLDDIAPKKQKLLRNVYAQIWREGDKYIRRYDHIKDSLAFEFSHQSLGIRLADYSAGILNGFLRSFGVATELFESVVWPVLRKDRNGSTLGWGICEIPTDKSMRQLIRDKLDILGLG